MSNIKTYSELIQLSSFEDRFDYLNLHGTVGSDTFGFDRYLNQKFYRSKEWQTIRNYVILRDNGCDLGIEGLEIPGRILIHHMNPITPAQLRAAGKSSSEDAIDELIMDPEYLISTTHITHNAIHYGSFATLPKGPTERRPNDTCPWKG